MPKAVKPRSYDSSRRKEQARATRRAVLVAAREVFIERGYAGASIEMIAARAQVSPETILAFKNKRTVLVEVLDVSIAGDDAPLPVLDRSWVQQIREEKELERRVAILARNGRMILERLAPIYAVLQGAGAADREIAAVAERYKAQRHAGQSELVRVLTAGHRLRKGMTRARAADVVFAVGSPETYGLLVGDRGWSPESFERWYGETLKQMLFG
jgi:AcrR family transcriptional regulator